MERQKPQIPLSERLKGIPGIFGIHLNEQAKFKLLKKNGAFELREYEPLLVAKATVFGNYNLAAVEAFKRLASYIFGSNQSGSVLSMTTPVFQQRGEMLVSSHSAWQESQENAEFKAIQGLTMSFVLPSDLTLQSAPIPSDKSIRLQEIPAQTWAVVSYSGRNLTKEIKAKSLELRDWIKKTGYKFEQIADRDSLRVAQYDGPSTLPFLRKNEVQIRLWNDEVH